MKLYEHGDMTMVEIVKLPDGLTESASRILLEGKSNQHCHRGNGTWYPRVIGQFVVGYFVAKKTALTHLEHGEETGGNLKTAEIADGVYEVRRQSELTHEGMKQVVD